MSGNGGHDKKEYRMYGTEATALTATMPAPRDERVEMLDMLLSLESQRSDLNIRIADLSETLAGLHEQLESVTAKNADLRMRLVTSLGYGPEQGQKAAS